MLHHITSIDGLYIMGRVIWSVWSKFWHDVWFPEYIIDV